MHIKMDHDEKMIMFAGAIFISIVVLVFIVNYAFKDDNKTTTKAYEFKENETIRIQYTTTTIRKTLPILCKNAETNNECENLGKYKLTRNECCEIGYCCKNAG